MVTESLEVADLLFNFEGERDLVETAGIIPEAVKNLYDKETNLYDLHDAKTDLVILDKLDSNPDFSKEQLLQEIEDTNQELLKDADTRESLQSRVDLFLSRRDTVRAVAEEYTTETEAFEGLFGVKPKGNVQVARGALSLYVICFNEEDFRYVLEAPFSKHPRGSVEGAWGGCIVKDCKKPGLDLAVVCARSDDLIKEADTTTSITTEEVLKHEDQHIRNFLMTDEKQLSVAMNLPEATKYIETISHLPEKEFANKLREYLIEYKEYMLEYGTKDEFSAFLEQGLTAEQAYLRLNEPSYNYPDIMAAHLTHEVETTLSDDGAFFFRGILRHVTQDFKNDVAALYSKVEELEKSGASNREIAMILANKHAKQIL